MANVTFGGNVSLSMSFQGTRNSDGTQQTSAPAILASLGMDVTKCTIVDQGLATTTKDDLDLTSLNLDGTGAKDLTGLYFMMLAIPVAGSGSGTVTCSSGTTNPYLGLPLAASGNILVQTSAFRLWFGDLLVASGAKTLDLTVSGTISYWLYIFAGPTRF